MDTTIATPASCEVTFLQRYWEEGDEFLDRIVTGDETWVKFVNAETKEQSKQWMHTHSPNKPKKFKQTLSNKKMIVTVFWNRKGILLTEFMAPGTTITSEVYCETLHKLRRSTQNKRRGMLSKGVVLLHDNARPHTAARTNALIKLQSRFSTTLLTVLTWRQVITISSPG